jgi:hypothetical protein
LTPNVAEYKKIRNESNDLYRTAKSISWAILANHLVSAFDAAITIKNYNKNIDYSLYTVPRYYAGDIVNTYGVAVSW